MRNLTEIIIRTKRLAFTVFSVVALVFLSLQGVAQTNNEGQNPERSSQAEQSSQYLQNIEDDPNVPNTSAWYAQPWIWAIVAAILILVIGVIARNSGRRSVDQGSENGLR